MIPGSFVGTVQVNSGDPMPCQLTIEQDSALGVRGRVAVSA